jgi:DNA polymerase
MFGDTLYLNNINSIHNLVAFKNLENDNGELDKVLIRNCKFCSSLPLNEKIVYGYGNKKPEIFIILESPSKIDILNKKLLSGPPGKLMDKILIAINRTRRKSTYITSLTKYKHENNHNPLSSEVSFCKKHLEEQIQILKPKVVLILGNVLPKFLLKEKKKIDELRGVMHIFKNIPTYVTYHPISLLKNEKLKLLAWKDFKIIKSFLNEE